MSIVYDYLVVGQGLAGTLIGHRLEKAGKSVFYLDAAGQTAASSVAAGIINPITGRRFVKSWEIDKLLPEADLIYPELERKLKVKIYHRLPLVRTLFNRGDKNDWDVRGGDPTYSKYLDDQPNLDTLPQVTKPAFSYGGVRHARRVDLALLTTAYRSATSLVKRFRAERVDYHQFKVTDQLVSYRNDLKAKQVIFCEGWRSRQNPWFDYLPHRGAKGEVLIVEIDGEIPRLLFKHRIFVVPRSDGRYWIGATTENEFDDDRPTELQRSYLEDRLTEVLTVPFRIMDHRAAVRPTVKDRRPMLGRHPEHPNLVIFNGLGTKGASLAPLSSKWLANHLLKDELLPREVSIERFRLP